MKVLFTICGRAGSKGIKNKNIKDFLGAQLSYYSLAAIAMYIERNPEISADVVLNTDSEELIRIVENNKFCKVDLIRRDASLGTDSVPKISVILDCLDKEEQRNSVRYDMVVDLDLTSPLRTVKDIENLVNKQYETKCDVAFSVTTARRNPYFNMVKKTDKGYKRVLESSFNTRQEAPEIFDMNASMYAYSPEYLKTGRGVLDGYCEAIEMYDTGVLDLDHENDFELMEVIGRFLFDTEPEFAEVRDKAVM